MSNVIWLAVIVALALIGVSMAYSGSRPSRLSRVRAAYHLDEAMREAQNSSEDEGAS